MAFLWMLEGIVTVLGKERDGHCCLGNVCEVEDVLVRGVGWVLFGVTCAVC